MTKNSIRTQLNNYTEKFHKKMIKCLNQELLIQGGEITLPDISMITLIDYHFGHNSTYGGVAFKQGVFEKRGIHITQREVEFYLRKEKGVGDLTFKQLAYLIIRVNEKEKHDA